MKVAMVLDNMDPSAGGREVYVSQVAPVLASRGLRVSIICRSASWRCKDVEVRELGERERSRTRRMLNFLADAGRATGGEFDIVHAMLPMPGAGIYQPHSGVMPARYEASVRRRRGIFRLSAAFWEPLDFYRRLISRLERQVVGDSRTTCLAVSPLVAGQFDRHFGRTEGVRVVFNGVNVPGVDAPRQAWRKARRKEIGAGDDEIVFITVAANFVLKGVPEAIRAFERWIGRRSAKASGRLIVVGGDDMSRRRLAAKSAAEGRVVFIPATDRLFEWYAAADACVLLSWYDSCSLVVLEAVRWGIPCITTVYNGAAEALAGGAGIVVSSPRDFGAVVEAMDELADPERRAKRSAACLAAAPGLSVERHVERLVEVYEEHMARR